MSAAGQAEITSSNPFFTITCGPLISYLCVMSQTSVLTTGSVSWEIVIVVESTIRCISLLTQITNSSKQQVLLAQINEMKHANKIEKFNLPIH